MPVTNHTVTVTLNGTDRTSLLRKDSLYVRASVGNDADTATFTLRGDTYTPNGWHTVSIAVNGTAVFGGYVVAYRAVGVGAAANKEAHWSVTCSDWSILLDQTNVSYGYVDADDTAILSDLFSRYLSADGFDVTTNVTNVADDLTIYFDNITLRSALAQLADQCGADWHIAPNKALYWYATDSPAAAAFNIDGVSPDGATTFDVLANSVTVSTDETQIINQVTVVGGERLTPGTADLFSADGTATRFQLAQRPKSLDFVTYVIGGTAYYARSPDDVGWMPGDKLRMNGGDYDVLVNAENRYVLIQNQAGSAPQAASGVVVRYFPAQNIGGSALSTGSQGEYGRTFAYTVYDDQLNDDNLATDYAQRIIDEYAYGRLTVQFSTTRHGLLPGRLITINLPALGVTPTTTDRLETEARDNLLQENGDLLLLESSGTTRQFLIQEVEIYPVATGQRDEFMIVAKVTAGKYVPSLFDTLKRVAGTSAGIGALPARRTVGRLSNLSNDWGEVRTGRAVLTDGGSGAFNWSDYAGHTGVVLGAEDSGGTVQGAMYILQGGTIKAKVGNITGLGSVGTVAPSGWGIWTGNGYFTGTVAGALVTGGTLSLLSGSVALSDTSGFNLICASGTTGFDDQRWIRWRDASSNGVAAQIGAVSTAARRELYLAAGTAGGTAAPFVDVRAYGTATGGGSAGDYSELLIQPDYFAFNMVRNASDLSGRMIVGRGSVVTAGSVYPQASNTGIHLGGTTNAWGALFLYDGTDEWKITINTSGVLTTVKV